MCLIMKQTDERSRRQLRLANSRLNRIYHSTVSRPKSMEELPARAIFKILKMANESSQRSLKRTSSLMNEAYKAVVHNEKADIAENGSLMDREDVMPCMALFWRPLHSARVDK